LSQRFLDACSVEVRDSLADIAAADWNALAHGGNPFLLHAFLHALEASDCLGERNGWYPRYFLIYHEKSLIAACPTYYTPCTGARFLIHPDHDKQLLTLTLQKTIIHFSNEQGFSGVHWLFVTAEESQLLASAKLLTRKDCQYHWHNREYQDFEQFLAQCTSRRRKTIRRERRHVSDANIVLVRRTGDTLTTLEWRYVHEFYAATFDRKWGSPSLTEEFFRQVGTTMGDRVLIVFAYHQDDPDQQTPIACSIMFIGDNTLYGRFWGCSEQHHSLHFEACYYQGIEFCIERKLDTFEPGAQGEHKISRGFEPTLTYSSHWISHQGFREAISRYLIEETKYVHERCAGLTNLLPFKQTLDVPAKSPEDPVL